MSVGASRPPKKHDGSLPSSCLPVPDRAKIPQNLLTQEPHFGNLFTLLENLSDIGSEVEHLVRWLCAPQKNTSSFSETCWKSQCCMEAGRGCLPGLPLSSVTALMLLGRVFCFLGTTICRALALAHSWNFWEGVWERGTVVC